MSEVLSVKLSAVLLKIAVLKERLSLPNPKHMLAVLPVIAVTATLKKEQLKAV